MSHAIARTVFAAFVTTVLASGPAHAGKPDSTPITERRTVAPFTAIHLSGPFRVVVTTQAADTIELSGPRLITYERDSMREHRVR
ncbi:MAG: hypothetical protein ABW069_15390 [Duganella sp.]